MISEKERRRHPIQGELALYWNDEIRVLLRVRKLAHDSPDTYVHLQRGDKDAGHSFHGSGALNLKLDGPDGRFDLHRSHIGKSGREVRHSWRKMDKTPSIPQWAAVGFNIKDFAQLPLSTSKPDLLLPWPAGKDGCFVVPHVDTGEPEDIPVPSKHVVAGSILSVSPPVYPFLVFGSMGLYLDGAKRRFEHPDFDDEPAYPMWMLVAPDAPYMETILYPDDDKESVTISLDDPTAKDGDLLQQALARLPARPGHRTLGGLPRIAEKPVGTSNPAQPGPPEQEGVR